MSQEPEPATKSDARQRSPLDGVLDALVFAPLGFALEFPRLFPELVEAGRRQYDFTSSLGRAVLGAVRGQPEPDNNAATKRTDAACAPPAPGPSFGERAEFLAEYDTKTARELIAQVQRWNEQFLREALAHERQNKARKTVLEAIQRRLAQMGT